MKEDKIPKIVGEAKEQPNKPSNDTDAEVSGSYSHGTTKGMGMAGLPHKQTGQKMSHESFHDKMTKGLCD